MVLRPTLRRTLAATLALGAFSHLAAGAAMAQGKPEEPAAESGRVTLPLADYLALVERAEALERARAAEAEHREAPVAEVVAQRTAVRIDGATAELAARFEALVQGHPKEPLALPFAGLSARAEVRPLAGGGAGPTAATVIAGDGGRGLRLVAPAPGRYAIEVRGRAALEDRGGVRRLALAPVAAPVAEVEVDLPADLAWGAPGAVVVAERVAGGRRTLLLATPRGAAPALEIRRRLEGTEAEKLLAESVVLTLFQLRPEGLRRHDVVLYEVSRGGLASLAVDLPPGLAVEQVATDEGDVVPLVEARRLTVERKRQLHGIGYLVLTSTPREGAALPAAPVVPAAEVRARYLAIASSVAARVEPAPAASWARVDLADLPAALGQALQTLDLLAAWRLQATAGGSAPAGLSLSVALLPPAPRLATLVRRRETTTLLTVDGTVLHRDRFLLDQAGAALDLALPAGTVLWSARVGEQPVRPVERHGAISIPLGFAPDGAPPEVEVVAVAERTVPRGRSQLALTLPEVAAPVVAHRWRLLLPDGARYRFRGGSLQPAAEPGDEPEAAESPLLSLVDRGAGGGAGVRGRVKLNNRRGDPAPGVTIELRSSARREPWTTVTHGDGAFLLDGLPAGRYVVRAMLEGFQTVEVPNVGLLTGKLADLEIVIRPATIQETIVVTGEVNPLFDHRAPNLDKELEAAAARDAFRQGAAELKQGLVGGVKPLPVAVPETGKELLLSGALPPAQVSVELEVRGKH
jgi:hypothetical protein